MKTEQRVIVDWMQRTMRLRNWSAEDWANRAGVASTTITRAMRQSYDGVTTLPVLDRLAHAALVPSPLDVLKGDFLLIELPVPDTDALAELVVPRLQEGVRSALRERLNKFACGDDSKK